MIVGAEVAVLCITKSGEVLNYQAFTDAMGKYAVAETMPESDQWDACLARSISSFHEHCTRLREGSQVHLQSSLGLLSHHKTFHLSTC
ncbi:hypothetical protein Q3G72_027026 [Acer saccharum]|nr:hypothetical protein Q3G72_027026 [Acer saccharum]